MEEFKVPTHYSRISPVSPDHSPRAATTARGLPSI
jgi:hypothetical protein